MAADNPGIRDESGQFNKGVSGNPTGRPKVPDEVKSVLKANTLPAVNTLVTIMQDKKAKHADRIRCAETVLDRVYGKAAQPIVGDNEFDALRVEATQYTKLIVDRARKLVEAKGDAE